MIAKHEILVFEDPVILVGAAPVRIDRALEALPRTWSVIAADGGVDALFAVGRSPELVIGDMDSAGPLPNELPRLLLASQEETDFEKCLVRIQAPLIVGLGFLEGRFDHTLAAIHSLMKLSHDKPVMLLGDTDLLLRVHGDFGFVAEKGERISVWPLGSQQFYSSTGLKWPLNDLDMAPGHLIGTSNLASGVRVQINAGPGDGYALILHVSSADALLEAILSDD